MGKKLKNANNSENVVKTEASRKNEHHPKDQPIDFPENKTRNHQKADRPTVDKENRMDEEGKPKDRKQITTKTFAHGLMDVSLLTANATQLRCVLSTPQHEFYSLLLFLIGFSITLQLIAGVMFLMSDYYKTQLKERAVLYRDRRKMLNFIVLAIILHITAANILISAFFNPVLEVSHSKNVL